MGDRAEVEAALVLDDVADLTDRLPGRVPQQLLDAARRIELRDEALPSNIAENLKGWLYGCDICQEVCPWNRFEQPTDETRFEPRNGETSLDLDDVIAMTHEEYVERFRRSAIKRAKLSGIKRNARALK